MWIRTYGNFLSRELIEKATGAWHDPRLIISQIEDPDFFFGILRDNGRNIIGMTTAKITDGTLVIGRLYVHPEHQGRGIGKELLLSAADAFPSIKKIRVEVFRNNSKGISFYLRQGFTETGIRQEKIEGIILDDIVVLEKDRS